ncbi:ABC transporter G family [Raphidocelis subcapitata]|uniref:ABC transporter G family n=1 Tax=Raphidocelis subcapitata TaxID=307507 RepID=A0A2V0PKS9_9CHLO|nr:ABC transporter G family [Raphidocelis subcapitata]|eukprot:GBF99632.1 ABC transporter G family [Raphidocelis subcapitata]
MASTFDGSGTLTALWVTAFALANVYVAIFLALALLNANPGALRRVRALLWRRRRRRRGQRQPHHGPAARGSEEGSPAAALAAELAAAAAAAPPLVRASASASGALPAGGRGGAAAAADDPSTSADAAVQGLDGEDPSGCSSCSKSCRGSCGPGAAAPGRGAAAGGDATSSSGGDDSSGDEEDDGRRPRGGGGAAISYETDISSLVALPGPAAPPEEPVTLEWREVSLAVSGVGGKRTILQGIYGEALPGELQALMGPSGAGKSTLLDALAMRLRGGRSLSLGGAVLANGRPRRAKDFLAASAYVPQHDNFVPTMTAWETVSFYAAVLLPDAPAAARAERGECVLQLMGLVAQKDTLVGGVLPGGMSLRGISGGERRRLAIATGVVAGPSVVFLDEVTSGLDSFAALSVTRFLRRMADGGHTLLASVHQPRAAIWRLYDKVTLLSQGRLLYHGPAAALVLWFQGLGYSFDAARHGSAPDWALDLVSLGFSKTAAAAAEAAAAEAAAAAAAAEAPGGPAPPQGFDGGGPAAAGGSGGGGGAAAARAGRPEGMTTQEELEAAAEAMRARLRREHPSWFDPPGSAGSSFAAPAPSRRAAAPTSAVRTAPGRGGPRARARRLARHFVALLWREALALTRNPADAAGRMATFAYVALLNGLIFYGMSDRASSLAQRIGTCYSLLAFFLLIPFVFMGLFWADKSFYLADAAARLYHPAAFYAAKVTAVLPFNVAVSVAFHLIFYGMAGLRHGAYYVARSTLVATISLCATLAPSLDVAFMGAIAFTALNLLACGYFQRFSAYGLPGFNFIRYISAMNWAWEGVVGVEIGDRLMPCGVGADPGLSALGFIPELLPKGGSLEAMARILANGGLGPNCVVDASVMLEYYGITRTYGEIIAILVGYLLGVTAVTYLALWRGARRVAGK